MSNEKTTANISNDVSVKLENLRHISETHRTLHNQRRKEELKAFFTVVTFYIASAAAFLSGKVKLPEDFSKTFIAAVIIGHVSIVVIAWIYIVMLHRANDVNKIIAQNSEDLILEEYGLKERVMQNIGNNHNPAKTCLLQCIAIALFAIMVIIIVWVSADLSIDSGNTIKQENRPSVAEQKDKNTS